jgi:peptidoglycan/xylan/chitin deacetylase (PgdA/CDA1 family)
MLRQIRRATLQGLQKTGVFRLVGESPWRRHRLLILCYHGISRTDEHLWRPGLYMPLEVLQERLTILKRDDYNVLPLGEGLRKLQVGELPPRSVAITFDDGTYDFYALAYPLLKSYGFPVTVYQTTYYCGYQKPIFNLVCSYLLWQRRGSVVDRGKEVGLDEPMDLRTEVSRHGIVRKLLRSVTVGMSGSQKNDLAAHLASLLGVNYEELVEKRVLHLMNSQEVAQLAGEGVDFQLHTHRHRTPANEGLFRQEIQDNRKRLQEMTKSSATHFCFPSGVYQAEFLPWLRAENVISATTCDAGLASSRSNVLLLPRFIDTAARTSAEFESWLTGLGSLLAFRRMARQSYVPPRD